MISVSEAIYIHDILIERFGGSTGIRDVGLLESALARPFQTFNGVDLYPESIEKAAALIESILNNHPFVDGNKRIGYVIMRLFIIESGKDIILEVSKVALDELADVLIKKATWKLEISGHTDNIGGENFNLVLSKKRAEALKNYLIFKGVDTNRLITFYFGETQPLIDNTTLEGRKKNRRVEMKITFD